MKIQTSLLLFFACVSFVQAKSPKKAHDITMAARYQIGITTSYDPAYKRLAYPKGDVPMDRGVCTDVVIRALRKACNMDLQKLVHEDMKKNFSAYPKIWRLKNPDKNIDHRRVPNLMRFFERKGYSVSSERKKFIDGDIVTCLVENRPHIMIVGNRTKANGVPLIIHNIGRGTREEDCLYKYKISGHYRIKK